MAAGSDNAPLIVIAGETASGKSRLAMLLAEKFNGEIIAADSWTVYKEFDVGTAKPTAEERAKVPHYLLDIADPRLGFSAAEFKRRALAAIKDITSRGKLPVLVGGTGLYIDSVIFDYSFLPAAEPGIRDSLSRMSIEELRNKIDEEAIDTNGIDLRNKRRLIRLLETNGARPSRGKMRPNTLIIGLEIPREQLRERIEKRVDVMLAAGLENEVAQLVQKYGWDVEPMKGIGYREFRDYFNGSQSLEQTRDKIIGASMNLAKRQRTWFKRNNGIHRISKQAGAVELVTTFLNK
jgi:tRNA dimethylallyltransferase